MICERRRCVHRRAVAGFTLLELLLVTVIGAILATLAVPAYDEQLRRARRAQAVSYLSLLQGRQMQFFLEHRRYAGRLRSLGHGEAPCIDAAGQPVDAASSRCSYRLDLTAGPLDFQLSATPVNAQRHDRRCGVLTLDATGRRGASGPAPVEECWR